MSEHTIMFLTDGETISDKFTSPSRLAQPGDTYEFTNTIFTIGKKVYDTGDRLNIIERTEKAPHNRVSSLGNLLVKCKYHISVWTNIDMCIANGTLKLVSLELK